MPTRPSRSSIIRFDQLSADERAVLHAIWRARGRTQALPVAVVAAAAGVQPRHAQAIVKSLVEVHRIPIGSSSTADRPGWYLCVSVDEIERNHHALRRRAVSILRRSRAFSARHSRLVSLIYGQQELPLKIELELELVEGVADA